MNWKFWKRDCVDMLDLVPEGDYTIGDIIESMTDAQLALCFYVANKEYREILEVVIKNRLRRITMNCKECNNTDQCKMSCSQRDIDSGYMVAVPPRLSYLDFILDKLPLMGDDDINVLYYSVWAELSNRNPNPRNVFDEEGEQ